MTSLNDVSRNNVPAGALVQSGIEGVRDVPHFAFTGAAVDAAAQQEEFAANSPLRGL